MTGETPGVKAGTDKSALNLSDQAREELGNHFKNSINIQKNPDLANTLKKYLNENVVLKSDLDNAQKAAEATKQKKNSDIHHLSLQTEKLRHSLNQQILSVEEEKFSLKGKLSIKTDKVSNLKQQLHDAKQVTTSARLENQSELNSFNKKVLGLEQKIFALIGDITQHENKGRESNEIIKQMQKRLKEGDRDHLEGHRRNSQERDQALVKLEKQLEDNRKLKEQLTHYKESLKIKERDFVQDTKHLNVAVTKFDDEKDKLVSEYEDKIEEQQQVFESTQITQQLESDEMAGKLENLKDLLESQEEKTKGIEDRLKKEIHTLKISFKEFEVAKTKELKELQSEKETLSKTMTAVKESLATQEAQKSELANTLAQKESEMKQLKLSMTEITKEFEGQAQGLLKENGGLLLEKETQNKTIIDIKETLAEQEAQKSELANTLAQKENEMKQLKLSMTEIAKEFEGQAEALSNENTSLLSEKEKLTQIIIEAKEKLFEQTAQKSKLASSLSSQQNEMKQLKLSMTEIEKELEEQADALLNENTGLLSEKESLSKSILEVKEALAEQESQKALLSNNITQRENEIDVLNGQVSQMHSDLESAKHNLYELEQSSGEKFASLLGEKSLLQGRITDLTGDLVERDQTIAAFDHKISEAEENLNTEKEKIFVEQHKLAQELKDLKQSAVDIEVAKSEEIEILTSDSKAALAKMQAEKTGLQEIHDNQIELKDIEVEQAVAEYEEQMEANEALFEKLNTEVKTTFEAQFTELTKDLDAKTARVNVLGEKAEILVEEGELLREEKAGLKLANKALSDEKELLLQNSVNSEKLIQELRNIKKTQADDLEDLKRNRVQVQETLDKKDEIVTILKLDLGDMSEKHETEIILLKQDLETFESSLRKRQEELESKEKEIDVLKGELASESTSLRENQGNLLSLKVLAEEEK
jgi:chromosome segregation ATPase